MTQNKSKKPNAKYVVICYAIHDKAIASHDSFDSEEDAFAFVKKDACNTYEEERSSASESQKDKIELSVYDDGTAVLSSCGGEYEWTWETIRA